MFGFIWFAIVQNKFQQANKTKINHINDNHIKALGFFTFFGDLAYCVVFRLLEALLDQCVSATALQTAFARACCLASRWASLL